jgi:hypothetical protein
MEFLEIWLQLSRRFNVENLYFKADYDALISNLSEADLNELGDFYEACIRYPDYLGKLNRWLLNERAIPMQSREKAIRNLCLLFGHLGQRGYKPFTKQAFSGLIPAKPDWAKLPPELSSLSESASLCQKFTYVASELGSKCIRETITDAERKLFEIAATHIRQIGVDKVISWYRRLGLREHVEASLMWKLIKILDILELPYYSGE